MFVKDSATGPKKRHQTLFTDSNPKRNTHPIILEEQNVSTEPVLEPHLVKWLI